jgi:DNA adenine methylase
METNSQVAQTERTKTSRQGAEKTRSRRLRTPIRWFGGRGRIVPKLLPLVPPHSIYVEVFGGGASLLLAKEPSVIEVYNDRDSGLVSFFRVLRDPRMFARFYELVALTPYSREEYDFCRDTWEEATDDVERAFRWFVVARGSFAGIFGIGWGRAVTSNARGMVSTSSAWLTTIKALPAIHERMMRVQIEHADFRQVLQRYDTPETFFHVDPPYLPETRRRGGYRHELTFDDHVDLVELVLRLQGKAMVAAYDHPVYAPLDAAGWRRHDFSMTCSAAGRTRASGLLGEGSVSLRQPRVETIWLSPNCLSAEPIPSCDGE